MQYEMFESILLGLPIVNLALKQIVCENTAKTVGLIGVGGLAALGLTNPEMVQNMYHKSADWFNQFRSNGSSVNGSLLTSQSSDNVNSTTPAINNPTNFSQHSTTSMSVDKTPPTTTGSSSQTTSKPMLQPTQIIKSSPQSSAQNSLTSTNQTVSQTPNTNDKLSNQQTQDNNQKK